MQIRLLTVALTVLALSGAIASCGGSNSSGASAQLQLPKGHLPAPLAAIRDQAATLIGGGEQAFTERLDELRGYPVVVNRWASWCPPCRSEFPYFASQAAERGGKIAFLGVDSNDNDDDAREFLAEIPVAYPSYSDPDESIATLFHAIAFPTTAFYDASGDLSYVHQGTYPSEQALAEDIDRYAR